MLNYKEYIYAIYQEHSFSKAAQKLFVSQPWLSSVVKKVEQEIKTMPNYFDEYDTIVHFIDEETFIRDHSGLAHGGFVLRTGKTSDEAKHILELSIKLDSNPEFTGSVLAAYARAVARLAKEGRTGALTVFDIPVKYLSPLSDEQLRKTLL